MLLKRKRILVLDDNEHWLATIKLILTDEYDLTLTTESQEAIECLKSDQYSLVILDLKLKQGESGLEVLKRMQIIRPNLPAVMLSGYPDVDSVIESMETGALDFILKGISDFRSELRTKVKEALEKSDEQIITSLIASGESAELEFRSSARWDMRDNRINKELEKIIVKTVAAFLNSEKDGTLLIGIDDGGTIIGLQHDYDTLKKKDRDGYESFLTGLLLSSYGKDCSPLIQITFHLVGGKEICRVTVRPSPKPIFVREGNNEHFFIRTGNSTRSLTPRETLDYCKIRWKQ